MTSIEVKLGLGACAMTKTTNTCAMINFLTETSSFLSVFFYFTNIKNVWMKHKSLSFHFYSFVVLCNNNNSKTVFLHLILHFTTIENFEVSSMTIWERWLSLLVEFSLISSAPASKSPIYFLRKPQKWDVKTSLNDFI